MKKINIDLIKDIIISILIVVCIILLISLFLYNKVSFHEVIPEAEEYKLSDEMQEALNETNSDQIQNTTTTYSIDAAALKQYEKTQEYSKGKQNPFAEQSGDPQISINGIGSGDLGGTSSSDTGSGNFYKDEGIK